MTATSPTAPKEIDQLFGRYAPAVRSFFARRLGNRADAEDLTQEVFARLAARTSASEPIANIEGYVFQIAANLLRHRARQSMCRQALGEEVLDQDWTRGNEEFTPERIALGKEACREVVAALQELPERVRVVFILSRFEELSGVEIARRLNVSISTVEKSMIRALAHLRERLR